jgi:hypothetical protein
VFLGKSFNKKRQEDDKFRRISENGDRRRKRQTQILNCINRNKLLLLVVPLASHECVCSKEFPNAISAIAANGGKNRERRDI